MSQPHPPSDRSPVRRDRWQSFLVGWTVFAVLVVAWLWWFNHAGWDRQVFVLQDDGAPPESFWVSARRNLLLVHLSLARAYPWLLLAPYVVWAATRFSLERDHLRRRAFIQVLLAAGFVTGCQALNRQVAAGRPLRLIVAVTETSSTGKLADAAPGETVTRLRKELRVNPTADFEHWPAEVDATVRVDSDGQLDVRTNTAPEAGRSLVWQSEPGTDIPPEMTPDDLMVPHAWLWRGRVQSAALDLFVFGSLCGLGHALHFRRRWQEREQRAAALESSLARARLHALQAQLQPHFLFNTLNSITALVRQNPPAAEEMLVSLSDLLRLALSQATRPCSSLREELKFLQLYLDIQQTRFGDRLRFEQDIQPELLDCAVPSLLLQPLVENALRHGLEPAGRPGTVRITGRRHAGFLELQVADDGVGCPALVRGQARLGVGLANVQERLRAMFEERASLTFANGAAGGLVVGLRLPETAA